MKKFILSFGLFFLMLAGLATDASAKDMSRRFGIGVDSTISSYAEDGRGLSAVYVINKYFGLQAIFGLNMTTAEITDDRTEPNGKYDTTIIEWNVALRGLIPIVLSSDVNLTAVVGFSASGRASDGFKSSDERYSKYNDGFQFAIDLGVRPEWFVSEHFSLHTQVGIGINIITSNGSELQTGLSKNNGTAYNSTNASGVEVDFFKNVDLLGMAGCTFWF
ncbi:MAG: hypothetical protein J6S69_07220 [Proteobacteria bacterium]|nr:hypothetical protein [Pseudomonadota bacterium]